MITQGRVPKFLKDNVLSGRNVLEKWETDGEWTGNTRRLTPERLERVCTPL